MILAVLLWATSGSIEERAITWSALGGLLAFLLFLFKRWFKVQDDAQKAYTQGVADATKRYEVEMEPLRTELARHRSALSKLAQHPELPESVRADVMRTLFNGRAEHS